MVNIFQLLTIHVWLRITYEGSVPECAYGPYRKFYPIKNGVYILEEVYINFNYTVSVIADWPVSPRGHM